MKAQLIRENLDFERGQDPKDAMGIGLLASKGIDKNVPPNIKDLGFNFRDINDMVYLDHYQGHTMYWAYDEDGEDEYDYGTEFAHFYKMGGERRHEAEISLTWSEINYDSLETLMEEGVRDIGDQLKRAYDSGGEEEVNELVNSQFSIIPDIGFHNFS